MNVQNYFLQVTIQKGRIIENDIGETEKVVDSTEMDDLFCLSDEIDTTELMQIVREETQKIS